MDTTGINAPARNGPCAGTYDIFNVLINLRIFW